MLRALASKGGSSYVSISLGVYYNLVDSVLNSGGGQHLGSPKIQDFDYFWKILSVFMIIYETKMENAHIFQK